MDERFLGHVGTERSHAVAVRILDFARLRQACTASGKRQRGQVLSFDLDLHPFQKLVAQLVQRTLLWPQRCESACKSDPLWWVMII